MNSKILCKNNELANDLARIASKSLVQMGKDRYDLPWFYKSHVSKMVKESKAA